MLSNNEKLEIGILNHWGIQVITTDIRNTLGYISVQAVTKTRQDARLL